MKNEIRYGKLMYLSFIVIDLLCLAGANLLASQVYLHLAAVNYGYEIHRPIVIIMLLVDILVTLGLNTLRRVLRRRVRIEIAMNAIHVMCSFFILAVILFSLRQGAQYSRVIVYLAYGFYLVFICCAHIIWRSILWYSFIKKGNHGKALLMTSDRFAKEGIEELKRTGKDLKYLYLLKNINVDSICDIPVIKDIDSVSSIICWEWIEKVYIYGVDHQMIPAKLISACRAAGKLVFSELDAIMDLWLHTVLNDPSVRGSEYMPVVYYPNMRGVPLLSYTYLAKRWGWSKSRVGRFILKAGAYGIISRVSFSSSHGSVISVCQYREMIFGDDTEELQLRRIGEILGLSRTIEKLPETDAELKISVETRVPPQITMPNAREALKIQVFRAASGSFFARQIPLVFYSSLGWGRSNDNSAMRAPPSANQRKEEST